MNLTDDISKETCLIITAIVIACCLLIGYGLYQKSNTYNDLQFEYDILQIQYNVLDAKYKPQQNLEKEYASLCDYTNSTIKLSNLYVELIDLLGGPHYQPGLNWPSC